MVPLMLPVGVGIAGVLTLGLVAAVSGLAYAIGWVWMLIDGILRADADYPGTEPNRKVLWVVGMVLLHPVAIVYFFLVFLKVRRSPRPVATPYTPTMAPPVPPAPQAPPAG